MTLINRFSVRILLFFISFYSTVLVAQENPIARQYGEQVLLSDLKDNLSIIASDALEGRKTGSRGQKMAAAFIRAHF
ncbi:MAG TPA: hypothetical protein DIS90_05615 [Cytophagales bacterium]|nr:hypothetical protein [Cytophagales bacterium]